MINVIDKDTGHGPRRSLSTREPLSRSANLVLDKAHGVQSLRARALAALLSEPAEFWNRAVEKLSGRREALRPPCHYDPMPAWEHKLHMLLDAPWPCPTCAAFDELWTRVVDSLKAAGINVGPMSFAHWNDGDTAFARSIWLLSRHICPERVVETGVAHGITSRLILEALAQNGSGHLWSIDRPPLDPALHDQVGIAVTPNLSDRWTYINGSSRRRLPGLLAKLAQIDIFIHDSMHSERNVRFELDRALAVLRPGGALIVDDIDINWGFHSFNQTFTGLHCLVCEAEPLRPDDRRFNAKGLFGIILKPRSS